RPARRSARPRPARSRVGAPPGRADGAERHPSSPTPFCTFVHSRPSEVAGSRRVYRAGRPCATMAAGRSGVAAVGLAVPEPRILPTTVPTGTAFGAPSGRRFVVMIESGTRIVVGVVPGQPPAVIAEAAVFARRFDAELICASVDPARYTLEERADGTVVSLPVDPDLADEEVEAVD